MSSESNIPNYEPHTMPTSTITPPSGYVLAGWCTVQDQTASGAVQNADPQTTCTGDSYADQGNIPASTVAVGNPTPTLNLYALKPAPNAKPAIERLSLIASSFWRRWLYDAMI